MAGMVSFIFHFKLKKHIFVIDLALGFDYYFLKIRLMVPIAVNPIKMDALSHRRNYEERVSNKNTSSNQLISPISLIHRDKPT
jgi:hypothetical protein